ncbi:hypothetical protein ACFQ1L_02380 [Phytohabitans flavus]|uniref:Uncharacterized protein n=1 Tax=Phytohabitans flavus TaxID=1076124 RepID=A0A6F8Y4Q8_9ACTN|nr:hypothetical protein [Phytohabitans flavus]BCB81009.1 hypothetical protein Pflav_074190 [Phytohabitans flavus]
MDIAETGGASRKSYPSSSQKRPVLGVPHTGQTSPDGGGDEVAAAVGVGVGAGEEAGVGAAPILAPQTSQ